MSVQNNSHRSQFAAHLQQFIGKTTIVYISSGESAGNGISGVVLSVSPTLVKIVTSIGTPPKSLPGHPFFTAKASLLRPASNIVSMQDLTLPMGSITEIPIERIIAVVHYAI